MPYPSAPFRKSLRATTASNAQTALAQLVVKNVRIRIACNSGACRT
jgi:ferredoxin